MEINIGWLAPNGIFRECDYMEHLDKATELIEFYYGKEIAEQTYNRPDEYLFSQGFLKFTREGIYGEFADSYVMPTNKQLEYISKNYITESQKHNLSMIMELAEEFNKIIGDEKLSKYLKPKIVHKLEDYPKPTEWIKIIANVPVEDCYKPKIGEIYPVIKSGNKYYTENQIKFILVNGEEVGVFVKRECELVKH